MGMAEETKAARGAYLQRCKEFAQALQAHTSSHDVRSFVNDVKLIDAARCIRKSRLVALLMHVCHCKDFAHKVATAIGNESARKQASDRARSRRGSEGQQPQDEDSAGRADTSGHAHVKLTQQSARGEQTTDSHRQLGPEPSAECDYDFETSHAVLKWRGQELRTKVFVQQSVDKGDDSPVLAFFSEASVLARIRILWWGAVKALTQPTPRTEATPPPVATRASLIKHPELRLCDHLFAQRGCIWLCEFVV